LFFIGQNESQHRNAILGENRIQNSMISPGDNTNYYFLKQKFFEDFLKILNTILYFVLFKFSTKVQQGSH